ncbi:MAG TPA: hypothetical protein VHN16_07755 [Streptosporangiaceae bacterium]|nr:hypothetical protein [Streptosporangiaceae bacterium]
MRCLTTGDLIPAQYRPSGISQPLRSGLKNMIKAWDSDEFVLDPSRITIYMLFEQIPAYLEFFGLGPTTPDELRAVSPIKG